MPGLVGGTHQAEGLVDPKVLAQKSLLILDTTFSKKSKNSIFGYFLPILATFTEVKSRFEKSW
jgi:hypothetical protein